MNAPLTHAELLDNWAKFDARSTHQSTTDCPVSVFWDGSFVRLEIAGGDAELSMTRDQAITLAEMLVKAVKAEGAK